MANSQEGREAVISAGSKARIKGKSRDRGSVPRNQRTHPVGAMGVGMRHQTSDEVESGAAKRYQTKRNRQAAAIRAGT